MFKLVADQEQLKQGQWVLLRS